MAHAARSGRKSTYVHGTAEIGVSSATCFPQGVDYGDTVVVVSIGTHDQLINRTRRSRSVGFPSCWLVSVRARGVISGVD